LCGLRSFLEFFGRAAPELLSALIGLAFLIAFGIALITIWRTRFSSQKGQSLPRKSWLRTVTICLWAAWILPIGLTIVVPAFKAGKQAYDAAERKDVVGDADSSGRKSVTTPDGRFALDVQTNWHDIAAGVADKGWKIAQANSSEQVGVLVAVDAREDVAVGSLDAYALLRLSQAKEEFYEFEVLETAASTALGSPAREVLVSSASNGNRVMLLFRFAETPDKYIQLRAWSVPSEFRPHERSLRLILDSIRESSYLNGSTSPQTRPR